MPSFFRCKHEAISQSLLQCVRIYVYFLDHELIEPLRYLLCALKVNQSSSIHHTGRLVLQQQLASPNNTTVLEGSNHWQFRRWVSCWDPEGYLCPRQCGHLADSSLNFQAYSLVSGCTCLHLFEATHEMFYHLNVTSY